MHLSKVKQDFNWLIKKNSPPYQYVQGYKTQHPIKHNCNAVVIIDRINFIQNMLQDAKKQNNFFYTEYKCYKFQPYG